MKGSDVVALARVVLHDAAGTRWPDSELVGWINLGCKFIAVNRPDACSVNAAMPLAAGAKQSIAGLTPVGLRLLDVIRDVATGRGVPLTDRQVLDTHRPNWYADTPGPTETYVYDNRDPQTFYVHPPAVASASLEILYAAVPVETTVGNLAVTTLTPSDAYLDALLNYVLYRCYAKDSDETHNANLASLYFQAATAALGLKTAADVGQSPDLNHPGGKISPGATAGGV